MPGCAAWRRAMEDYKKLLAKYIQYIKEIEGTDYLGYDYIPTPFTEAEWDELRKLTALEAVDMGMDNG